MVSLGSSVPLADPSGEMARIEKGLFESLEPGRYVSFLYPNPLLLKNRTNFSHENNTDLRIAVLDSPAFAEEEGASSFATTAAMLVPRGRELDCTFSTKAGHFQLIHSAKVSRLVLIARYASSEIISREGYLGDIDDNEKWKEALMPLMLALCPRSAFQNGLPSVPFLCYTDGVERQVILEKLFSPGVGMILVEDVELLIDDGDRPLKQWRRRLRFERMPNLIQTEVAFVSRKEERSKNEAQNSGLRKQISEHEVKDGEHEAGASLRKSISDHEVKDKKNDAHLDLSRLVHSYLSPIVAGLVLVSTTVEECLENDTRPKLLSLGVGGGALLTFLKIHFEFSIFGVEKDEIVLQVAKRYFGLEEDKDLQIKIGDGLKVIENISNQAVEGCFVPSELARSWHNVDSNGLELEKSSENPDFSSDNVAAKNDVCVKATNGSTKHRFNNEIGHHSATTRHGNSNIFHNDAKMKRVVENSVFPSTETLVCNIEDNADASVLESSLSEEDLLPRPDGFAQNASSLMKHGKCHLNDPRMHVIVVDMDSDNATVGLCAPPVEVLEKKCLLATRIALHESGILAINVASPNKRFYDNLVSSLGKFFPDLYEIRVSDGENYVLFACASHLVCSNNGNAFHQKVKSVIPRDYIQQLRKVF